MSHFQTHPHQRCWELKGLLASFWPECLVIGTMNWRWSHNLARPRVCCHFLTHQLWTFGSVWLSSGLGLGLTMWDLSNMLVGWFIGHFGLLGVHKEVNKHPLLNYVGLVLAAVSLVFFSLSAVLNNPDDELSPSKKEPGEDWRLKIQNKGQSLGRSSNINCNIL